MSPAKWYIVCAFIGAALAGCSGNIGPAGAGQAVTRPAERDPALVQNVLGVIAYYNSFNPWLWNESRDKPVGISVQALYLEGPNSKGVFGDGVIRPKMFVRSQAPGSQEWSPVKEWSLDVEQARQWRSKKETAQGWGYRIPLPFGDIDLAGREIRMVIEFHRADGRIVASSKKDFRVPGPPAAVRK